MGREEKGRETSQSLVSVSVGDGHSEHYQAVKISCRARPTEQLKDLRRMGAKFRLDLDSFGRPGR